MKDQWKLLYGKKLVQLARAVISRKLKLPAATETEPDLSDFPSALLEEKRGVFVTLQKNGRLRGCIGSLEGRESVLEGVKHNAVNAAFHDPRFSPVGRTEMADMDIEVSILSEPKPLEYSDYKDLLAKLRPGIDGVIIR
ncbi:MAG: AmmeMemoRadiSam system protein A, partial [Desulfotignum sp.]|nr:AmmeMemoRadiSam system protein A [Desulfotignum sp.]